MLDTLSHPLCQQLTVALLHFLWQGAVLAVALHVVLRLNRSAGARRRYLLSLGTLGLMVACLVVTFAAAGSRDAVKPALGVTPTTPASASAAAAAAPVGTTGEHRRGAAVSVATPAVEQSVIADAPAAVAVWPGQMLRSVQPYCFLVWTLGVTLLAARLLLGWGVGQVWLRGDRRPLPTRLAASVAAIGRRLGVVTVGRVFASKRAAEALAVGFWRPVVLVPASWLAGLTPAVLEAVIAHELAHVRRWDLWANLFQRVAETLLFYHPAVWWVSRQAALEREMCCDEVAVAVTGRRLGYAEALKAVAELCTNTMPAGRVPHGEILATPFSGGTRMDLLTRVRNVLGLTDQRRAGLAWPVCAVALAVPFAVSLASAGLAASPATGDEASGGVLLAAREGDEAPKPGPREGDAPRPAPREGDAPRPGPRDGEGVRPPGPREGDGARRPGPREGDGVRRPEQREGDGARRPAPRDGEGVRPPLRDGEGDRPVARDGERARPAPRDGEGGRPPVRDGEGARPPVRDGERAKPAPRDGEGQPTAKGEDPKQRRVFAAYDDNSDGFVTFPEWIEMKAGPAASADGRTREQRTFTAADANRDQKLTFAEFLVARGSPAPRPGGEGGARPGVREGEGGARPGGEGDGARRPAPRDGEGARRPGPRDGDAPKPGVRDGDGPRPGLRDGDAPKPGLRDGDVRKPGPRDGDAPKPGPREGDRSDRPQPRDGETGSGRSARDEK